MRIVLLLMALLALSLPAAASTIVAESYKLPAIAAPMAINVYRPDGAPPAGGWPVLYLLHGLGGTQNDWLLAGGLQATLDGLIASGAV